MVKYAFISVVLTQHVELHVNVTNIFVSSAQLHE